MHKNTIIIGILGGAGPDATIDLQAALSQAMKTYANAQTDQAHFRVITDNNTTITDRSLGLHGKGPTPLPDIIKTATNLVKMGCHILLYPCNTAHVFLPQIQQCIPHTQLLDMVQLTCDHIHHRLSSSQTVGILCTDITKQYGLYENISDKTIIYPSENQQAHVMLAIFLAKAGYWYHAPKTHDTVRAITDYLHQVGDYQYSPEVVCQPAAQLLDGAITDLKKQGADTVVLGCTEIPLCINTQGSATAHDIAIVNPTEILATQAVKAALLLNHAHNKQQQSVATEAI